MGLFDDVFKDDESLRLSEKDIAFDMLKDSKFGITSLAMATSETVNPELRQILDRQLTAAVAEHHELSDIALKKSWYPAYDDPTQQLKNDCKESEQLIHSR